MNWELIGAGGIVTLVLGIIQALIQRRNEKRMAEISSRQTDIEQRKADSAIRGEMIDYTKMIIEISEERVKQTREDAEIYRNERDAERGFKRGYRDKYHEEKEKVRDLKHQVIQLGGTPNVQS